MNERETMDAMLAGVPLREFIWRSNSVLFDQEDDMTKEEYEKDQARLRENHWDERDKARDATLDTLRGTPCALCGEPAVEGKPDIPSCLHPYPGQWVHGRQGFRLCGDCIPVWYDATPEPCKDGFYPEWYDKQTLPERLAYHQVMAQVAKRVTGWRMKGE